MTTEALTHHRPARPVRAGEWIVDITPENAGWGYAGLRVWSCPRSGLDHATGEDKSSSAVAGITR
jgi:5-deoxy-D-glucuronate isomerase